MTAMATPAIADSRKLKGEDVGVPVRRLGQTYGKALPRYWMKGNAFLSMFFNGFSATLPAGEEQFMRAVRHYQDKITEPVLKAQIRAFIGQEAHHSREHEAFNEWLKQQETGLVDVEARMEEKMAWMLKHFTPRELLAWTVCAEHLTALMADFMLAKRPEILEDADPTIAKIWAWHAIEETEHKAVAFDVYDQVVGDRKLLRKMMARTTAMFLFYNSLEAVRLMRNTDRMTDVKTWVEGVGFIAGMMRDIGPEYMDFFRNDYHPWQHDNRSMLARARARWLGEKA